MKPYLIIGNGALGIAIASRILEIGESPRFLGRQGPAELKGVKLQSVTIDLEAPTDEELSQPWVVFITVKAHHLETALKHLEHVRTSCPVVYLGNGFIDNLWKETQLLFPDLIWRVGLTTFAVSQISEKKFEIHHPKGQVVIGPLLPKSPTLGEKILFEKAPAAFVWNEHAHYLRRKKWLFNTALNTLCGAHRLRTNGAALSHEPALRLLFHEAFKLGTERWGAWQEPEESLYRELLALIQATSTNENSMSRDVRFGKPTESEYLAGVAEGHEGYPTLKSFHHKIAGGFRDKNETSPQPYR